jgi:uroporphyrinogen-III synthase
VRPAPLLVVRPEPGNAATLAAAKALGLEAHGDPLFEVVPVPWTAPPAMGFDAVLIGSANVLRHGGEALVGYASLPAYVVGLTTAEAARQAGFTVAAVGSGGLQGLVARLAEDGRRRVLRPLGTEHVPLEVQPDTSIETVVVYEARPLPLSASSAAFLGENTVVMLHSAAAARHFAAECDRLSAARHKVALACIGPRVVAAAGEGWASVASAERPDDTALLALAARMCQNPRFGETDAND